MFGLYRYTNRNLNVLWVNDNRVQFSRGILCGKIDLAGWQNETEIITIMACEYILSRGICTHNLRRFKMFHFKP